MNDITALAQRLRVYAEEFSYPVLSPDDCRSLVEALEAKQPHHNGLMQLSNELVMAKQRIAELESRTVTVKLPELPVLGTDAEWYQGYAAGTSSMRKGCATALRAAGIQVIEGEQKNG